MGYMDAYLGVDLITEELERGQEGLKKILADLNQELSLYESAFAKEEKRWSFLVVEKSLLISTFPEHLELRLTKADLTHLEKNFSI